MSSMTTSSASELKRSCDSGMKVSCESGTSEWTFWPSVVWESSSLSPVKETSGGACDCVVIESGGVGWSGFCWVSRWSEEDEEGLSLMERE